MNIGKIVSIVIAATITIFASNANARNRALFEPPADRQLLIIGQDLGAIGGLPAPNNDGYIDHIPIKPAGVTTYTSLPFLMGLKTEVNLGSGNLCAQCILDNAVFNDCVLAIGLHIVDEEKQIAEGSLDKEIKTLAEWVKTTKRPVLLRIGYEFDGKWNHYDPENYKKAFQRIVTLFKELKVTNCATVWQACTSPYNDRKGRSLDAWYPGDEYVDWMGYSWFLSTPRQHELTDELLNFARSRGKPVMVCESSPQGYDIARLTKGGTAIASRTKKTPQQIWDEWYDPYFSYIEKNKDVIKIVAYINVNWDSELMWGPPYWQGYWGDSRVETNDFIQQKWLEIITKDKWMKASPTLFQELQTGTEAAK